LLFSEAWSSMRMNLSTTFAATMTVLIGMCLLGLFIALGTWVLSYSNHVKRELVVHVYFATGSNQPTQAQEAQVGQQLRKDTRIKAVTYVSKAAAFKTQAAKLPALYANVPTNPLPDSYLVKPKNPNDAPKIGRDIQKQVKGTPAQAALWPGVNDIKWGDKTTKRVLTVAEVISIVFLVAIVLLVTASTLLIANTIRLSIFSRRREIEVMKLVGASNWFIRGPFVLEGFICGVVGSALAVFILGLGKVLVVPAIDLGTGNAHAWPFTLDALLLLGVGLLLGAAGSGLTLRRFLQV
jgi:cell division transport system permease protein